MFLTDIIATVAQWCTAVISALGYPGIIVLMTLESMVFPLPSEMIMPFAGFLAGQGVFSFWPVVIFSVIGSLLGSLISYAIGFFLGRGFIVRYGRFFLLHEADLVWAEGWFARRGAVTILIGRFIPVVRHIISIPAGTAKMNVWKFLAYTGIGAAFWNAFLTWCGYELGERWSEVEQYSDPLSYATVIVLFGIACWWVWHHWKTRRMSRTISS
jgi:membrane protein DedA with SNARE-associated domain